MANPLFELFVKLGFDDSEFKKGVDDAKKDTDALATKLKKGLVAAAKMGAAAIGAASTAVIGLGKIGFDYNRQMETYTTNFEVMMGDAEAAAKKVEELKEMGAKTPFELGDLADATQTLLAFNVSADDSNSVLSKLGDISLGNVQKLESLTRAYGKMNASQKVTLEDINMMIDAGFNPLLIVAEQTGQTMEEVYESISDGEVSFEQITEAIDIATSSGGQFYQGMEKASQTTQGLISTLQDVTKSKIGEFFEGVSGKIAEALPYVISFIENIDVKDVIQNVKNEFESLKQTFIDLLPVIAGITAATLTYKAAMGFAGLVNTLKIAIQGLNMAMKANPFVLVASLIAGLVTAIITLWHTNEDFRNALISAWEFIRDKATEIFGAVANFFTETIPNAFDSVLDWFKDIGQKFEEIGSNIVDGIWEGISNAWEGLKKKFTDLWDKLIGGTEDQLGINSPSKVFAGIGKNMALGVGKGWEDEFGNINSQIRDSMDFGTASIDFSNSALGKTSAATINAIGQIGNEQKETYLQATMVTPEGTKLADWLLAPLVNVANSRGTPIVNNTNLAGGW